GFVEERMIISARCLGGAERAPGGALACATQRQEFGPARVGYQGGGVLHARAAAVKLHASEMAGRVVDRAVQVLGGRGYMRENPVERLYRDLRVDRIWEGTSEIQRVVLANELVKRGVAGVAGWPEPAEAAVSA